MTPILEVRHVTKRFGGLVAVDDVSFSVSPGEILCVIGPNGAGKSTLFSVLSGFTRPEQGAVYFCGKDITGHQPHRIARMGLSRSFQIVQFFPDMTVEETIVTAALLRHPLPVAIQKADTLLQIMGLHEQRNASAAAIPIQGKKRLELAKCVATEPKLILLDEVMAGLTLAEAEIPIQIIQTLRDQGMTFVLVEHVMPVVMKLADRIVVLNFGKLLVEGRPADVVRDKTVQEAYLGGEDHA
ncbi:MAG: ABC transporter ATP-binding protein [Kaistia sp. SCN 65-12]|uniref:ABC transporter ATP-binding protein n=1 Tax=Hyphomicrobium sp. CS1BSMeth3 TaxID=1892844 RepID=UPI00086CA6F6|nr:ABC transporter ATP-binding protein [Hyphomicrobium sp. CS1BSMeth3]ODT22623.1 MAG: ABC transporter ATP-binding protein [Kaistia sp. SCN 65-12]